MYYKVSGKGGYLRANFKKISSDYHMRKCLLVTFHLTLVLSLFAQLKICGNLMLPLIFARIF
jgi:hypothetical protein